MLITYQEALEKYGSRHYVRKAVASGELRQVSHDLYAVNEGEINYLDAVTKKYPYAVVTGPTALYSYGIIDLEPEQIDLATKRGGSKIPHKKVKQHFVPEEWLYVGMSIDDIGDVSVPIYDKERMLLELMRTRNKIPYEMYRKAVAEYRKCADELDMQKLKKYAELIPRGKSYLARIMLEVF